MTSTVAADLAAIDRLAAEAHAWLDSDSERLGTVNGSVSHWSPRMQIDHAALATSSVCVAVERSLRRDPRCTPPGPTEPRVAAILAAGAIPRGRAEAPDAMRPAPSVAHAEAQSHVEASRARTAALVARAAEIEGATARFPHFALGPMTATEWIRFARIHFEHHFAIAREAARPS